MFTGIDCLDGTFSLQVKPDRKLYQDIIILVGIDETTEWCNKFMLVPKPNGKIRLYLDLARLNQACIRLAHRGLTLNDIYQN